MRAYDRLLPGAAIVAAVAAFNLFWYCRFLSFPLAGEDGAANYSFLLEGVRNGGLSFVFPTKWLEGLGQPNAFVTVVFDPFSWLMLLPIDAADAFRLSMAARATVCWLATYLFARSLTRRTDLALVAASINMLLCFTLGHSRAVPTIAGIPNATHYAVFPLLLWALLGVARSRSWFGRGEAVFLALSFFFFITFPLSSAIGFAVAMAFGLALVAVAKPNERRGAALGVAKAALIGALILFLPKLGLGQAWSALVGASARTVFADELFSYGRGYNPPYMWQHVPTAIKLVLIFALGALVYPARWPRYLRATVLVLVAIVVGVQAWSLLQDRGAFHGALDKLPRAHYLEFYLPTFYALAAAFALRYWYRLVPARLRTARAAFWFVAFSIVFGLVALMLREKGRIGVAIALGAVAASCVAAAAMAWRRFGWPAPALLLRRAGYAAVPMLAVAALVTWTRTPGQFHPFARTCVDARLACRDEAGPTMGSGKTEITAFLRASLAAEGEFTGRAETLLVPHPRFSLPQVGAQDWTPALFDQYRSWYQTAYEAQKIRVSYPGYFLRTVPQDWRWEDRERLDERLRDMAAQGDVLNGILPEAVVAEILRAEKARGRPLVLQAGRFSEVQIMVEERDRGFADTGNGMMLRALPFHDIPVASSYEQSLDFLYYLTWTRYVNEGGGKQYNRSINFTALETVHPARLALLGVRYVVARESAYHAAPALKRVLSSKGYGVYEVPSPNTSGWGVAQVRFAPDLSSELGMLRAAGFDPRAVAVVSKRDAALFGSAALSPLQSSKLTVQGNAIVFEAAPRGGESFAVLPFRYSRCLEATWLSGAGNLVRADLGLLGVRFAAPVAVRIEWRGGYGSYDCIRADASLIAEAKAAAGRYPD